MVRVLFVCLGNICRSPTAHGVLLEKIRQRGLSSRIDVDSAGTGAWHIGKSPDARAMATASVQGYDLSPLRARQVCVDDFGQFDIIIAMDKNNLADLQALFASGHSKGTEPVLFLSEYLADQPILDVPDPYYGGDEGFEQVLNLVEKACDNLLDSIVRDYPDI